ncbi:ATP-binding cassette sub-family A member 3 [Trichonephila clavipes]|nr:ATP-binding cassette sub-family A member 3 [Trichonephila clavipes]
MFETTPRLRQFVILLYKGLLLRKRHYIVTFTEIVLPVLVACIPVIIMSEVSSPRDDFRPGKRSWVDYKTYEPFNPFQIPTRYRDIQFLHVPDSPVANQFMNDSVEMFRVNTDHRSKLSTSLNNASLIEVLALISQKHLVIDFTVFSSSQFLITLEVLQCENLVIAVPGQDSYMVDALKLPNQAPRGSGAALAGGIGIGLWLAPLS